MERRELAAPALDFAGAIELARAEAERALGEAMLLSWYDRERDIESPGHVSECHRDCPTPGWWDYAENRGGTLAVVIDGGRYTFCFLALD